MAGEFKRYKNFFNHFKKSLDGSMRELTEKDFAVIWQFPLYGNSSGVDYSMGISKWYTEFSSSGNKVMLGIPLDRFSVLRGKRRIDFSNGRYGTEINGKLETITNDMANKSINDFVEKGLKMRLKSTFSSVSGREDFLPIVVWDFDKNEVRMLKFSSTTTIFHKEAFESMKKGFISLDSYTVFSSDSKRILMFDCLSGVEFEYAGKWRKLSNR